MSTTEMLEQCLISIHSWPPLACLVSLLKFSTLKALGPTFFGFCNYFFLTYSLNLLWLFLPYCHLCYFIQHEGYVVF